LTRLAVVLAFLLVGYLPAESLEQLQAQESALIEQYSRIRAEGLDARTVAKRLETELLAESVSASSIQSLRRIGIRGESTTLPTDLEPLLNRHLTVDRKWSDFHDAYDRFIQAKTLYLVRRYHQAATRLAQEQPDNARLQKLWQDLAAKAAAFETNVARREVHSGDAARFSDARHFADAFIAFWEQAVRGRRGPLDWTTHQMDRGLRFMLSLVKNAAVLWEFYPAYHRLVRNQPVAQTIAPAFDRSLRWLGYRQTFENVEVLESPIEDGTVRVLAPNHVHGYLDAAMTVKLPLERGRIFNAPTFWASPWLTELLKKNDQFVCVSMGPSPGNPMPAVLRHLDNHQCDTIFIQAEGSLSTGMAYEIRRPADNFASVLSLMRNRGYAIEVVPVSLPRHYRIFGDLFGRHNQTRDLVVEVAPPLSPRLVDFLIGTGDPKRLSRLLRQFWLDAAHDEGVAGAYTDRPLGAPLIAPLIELLDGYVKSRTGCSTELLEQV
jgi:hypothetical protein